MYVKLLYLSIKVPLLKGLSGWYGTMGAELPNHAPACAEVSVYSVNVCFDLVAVMVQYTTRRNHMILLIFLTL